MNIGWLKNSQSFLKNKTFSCLACNFNVKVIVIHVDVNLFCMKNTGDKFILCAFVTSIISVEKCLFSLRKLKVAFQYFNDI